MAKKRKKYVSYEEVRQGLHRPLRCGMTNDEWNCDPRNYIRTLKSETGLSYKKITHDLRVDSGVNVADSTVQLWGKKG